MKNFWDERYSSSEYVYGLNPNIFLEENLKKLSIGNVLFPMEGEGRNAVFAASLGFDVTAFDYSIEGKLKADKLAEKHQVKFNYEVCTLENFKAIRKFQTVGLFYTHVSSENKSNLFDLVHSNLESGGVLIAEVFSENQLGKTSGGPKDITMLFSKEEIENEFSEYKKVTVVEKDIVLDEGVFHQGNASVLRVYAVK